MINNVVIVGRLTQDPELRKTKTNKSVCSFSLAVSKGKDNTKFFRFTVWEKGAEYLANYGKKGNIVAVQGELDYSEYTDKDGKKQRMDEVLCNRVQLLSVNKEEKKEFEEPSFFTKEMDVSNQFKLPEQLPWEM